MNRVGLDAAIQKISDYTKANPQLHAAHHFLYDSPLNKVQGAPEFVIMGMNPGESCHDWNKSSEPTEITSRHDFNAASPSPNRKNWRRIINDLTDGRPAVLTELFFWSASREEFKKRFGRLWKSEHLPFCARMNRLLLDHYQPAAVIFTGIGNAKRVKKEFTLCHVNTHLGTKGRLVEHYRDDQRPWFIIKHPTGSHGFSDADKCKIKIYIHSHLCPSADTLAYP